MNINGQQAAEPVFLWKRSAPYFFRLTLGLSAAFDKAAPATLLTFAGVLGSLRSSLAFLATLGDVVPLFFVMTKFIHTPSGLPTQLVERWWPD